MSIEAEQYLRLKNKIFSDLNVKTFNINRCHKLVEIPVEIGLLQELEYFNISYTPSIKDLPHELTELSSLKHISLTFNYLKKIPLVLGQITSLNKLDLSHNSFLASTQWITLAKLPQLHYLNISYTLQNKESLPIDICKISSLQELSIVGNRLKTLPKELALLTKLKTLRCGGNNFEEFPVVLAKMPQLQTLTIPAITIKKLPDEVLGLQHIPFLTFTSKSHTKTPYIYEFERFLRNIKIYSFDSNFQHLFLNILRGDSTVNQLSNEELFSLLHCASPTYINQALQELELRIQQKTCGNYIPPKAGDKIIIKGKISGKVSELKARLEQHDIQTGTKITAQTTHILLATMPNQTDDILLDNSISIITEQLLINYLNELEQPYLLAESAEHNLEQLRALLHSEQTDNILMALEIIKGGGLPDELITDLFLIYKFNKSQKIKRIIIQIIGQYAPLEFVTALKNRKSFGRYLSESIRRKNLEFYCAFPILNKVQIATFLQKKGIHIHSFVLFNLSLEEKIAYFSPIIKNGILNLASLELTELPDDFGLIPGIKQLDLSHNNFTTVPSALFQCQELKTLYIRGLYHIQANPDDLWKIDALQRIHAGYYNKFTPNSATKKVSLNGKTIVFGY